MIERERERKAQAEALISAQKEMFDAETFMIIKKSQKLQNGHEVCDQIKVSLFAARPDVVDAVCSACDSSFSSYKTFSYNNVVVDYIMPMRGLVNNFRAGFVLARFSAMIMIEIEWLIGDCPVIIFEHVFWAYRSVLCSSRTYIKEDWGIFSFTVYEIRAFRKILVYTNKIIRAMGSPGTKVSLISNFSVISLSNRSNPEFATTSLLTSQNHSIKRASKMPRYHKLTRSFFCSVSIINMKIIFHRGYGDLVRMRSHGGIFWNATIGPATVKPLFASHK